MFVSVYLKWVDTRSSAVYTNEFPCDSSQDNGQRIS